MFQCSPVYYANHEATEDIVINQGGTDSSKTYSILQLLFTIAAKENPPTANPIITVVSESVPNLKKGAYRTAKDIYNDTPTLQALVRDWNETDRTIYFKNGWLIEFNSYENEQQAKQGKRQYLFVNEAQGVSWRIFWQLAKRTRMRTFIDYNPTAPFWAHEKLIGTDPDSNDLSATVLLLISDHRHNPFISEEDHRRTEGIKDKDLWRVYARGLTGNLEGLIYPNWKMIPDKDFPEGEKIIGGLDYGYTNDPTAGAKICIVGESVFAHELCYTPGLAPIEIKQIFAANGFRKNNPIYCEHDPEMTRDIRKHGGLTLIRAKKGQGSLNAGIMKLKKLNIFYTASSKNIDNERKKYMWMTDPKTGKSINMPAPGPDHLLDAIRYAVYSHSNMQPKYL